MMPATMTEGERDILALFRAAWVAGGHDAAKIAYDNSKFDKPSASTIWARFELGYAGSPQRTLGGVTGLARRGRVGNLTISLHSRLGDATAAARGLVELTIRAYEGKRSVSGAVFTDAHEVSHGSDGVWWQSIVSIDFEYHQLI